MKSYVVSRFTVIPSTYGWYCVRQYGPLRYSQNYRIDDAVALADWLDERASGYPKLENVTYISKTVARLRDSVL